MVKRCLEMAAFFGELIVAFATFVVAFAIGWAVGRWLAGVFS